MVLHLVLILKKQNKRRGRDAPNWNRIPEVVESPNNWGAYYALAWRNNKNDGRTNSRRRDVRASAGYLAASMS